MYKMELKEAKKELEVICELLSEWSKKHKKDYVIAYVCDGYVNADIRQDDTLHDELNIFKKL